MLLRFMFRSLMNQAGDNGAGGGAPAPGAAPGAAPPASNAPWYGEIPADRPQEFRDWVSNKGFKDPLSALESYHNAEKLLGAPADQVIRLPKPDDAQGWEGVWNRLGRPEKPEQYELPVPTGADGKPSEADAKFSQFAAQLFHKAGVPKSMAQAIAKEFNDYSAQQRQEWQTAIETQANQALDALKGEWGQEFDKNAEVARRGLNAYGKKAGLDEGDIAALEGAIGTAKMLKMFLSLGETVGEHDFGGAGNGGSDLTPAQARQKLEELREKRIKNEITQGDYLKEVERLAPLAAKAA